MKPQKLFKKVMLLALVLAVLGGVLVTSATAAETATSAIPSTPTSVYNMLNGGITFETYTSNYGGAYTYMYDATGMYLTDQYGNESRTTGISIVDVDTTEDGVDYELKLTETAYFLNGYTSSSATAPNSAKYAKSQALLDLLFSTGGPQKFSLSMDMTFHGEKGTTSNVEASSDSNEEKKSHLYTYYRGTSAITFNGSWLFKATSANLPVYSVDKDNPVTVSNGKYYPYIAGTAVTTEMADRGYLYGSEDSISIHASGADDYTYLNPDLTGDKKDNYAEYGNTTACISPTYMKSEDVVTYKLGEPVRLRMEFDKTATAGKVTINVYASTDGKDEVLLTTKSDIGIGNSAMKSGLRFFDKKANVSLDNIAVDIEDCGNDHDSVWVDHTTSMTDVKYNGEVVSTKIVSTCKTCNTEYRTSYTNPVFVTELRDEAGAVMEGSRVDGANTDKNKRLGYYLFKNTGLGINHVDDIYDGDGNPIVLSLDLKVEALPEDANCQNGKSLLTWKPNTDAYYYQFIRLYPGGEIRMVNSDGRWNYSNSENAKLAVSETPYEIDIIFEPDTGAYRLFIDGELIGQSVCTKLKSDMLNSDNTTYPRLRVGDSDAGTYTVSDLVVTEMIPAAEHAHSYVLADEKTVASNDTTLTCAYTCYCGENGVSAINGVVVDNLYNAYADTAAISGLPTEGDFWISTEYNVRNAEAVTADTDILSIGGVVLVKNDAAVTSVGTDKYVVRVCYTGENVANVEVFRNGTRIKNESVTFEGDATVLTLGDANVSGVRFLNTKIVTIGDVEIPVVPEFKSAGLVACYHDPGEYIDVSSVEKQGDGLVYSTTCVKCGEAIKYPVTKYTGTPKNGDDAWSSKIDENGDIISHSLYLGLSKYWDYTLPTELDHAANSNVGAYQVDFTLALNEVSAYLANTSSKGYNQGRSLLKIDESANAVLRAFPIADESSATGYSTTEIAIKTTNDERTAPTIVGSLKVGKDNSVDISLILNPTENFVIFYVNGQYVHTRTGVFSTTAPKNFIRFGDGSQCSFNISNLTFYKFGELEHTHTDKWAPETTISVTENTISRTYTCYCGETVTAEIENVVIDKLYDEYQDSAVIEGLPTQGEFWITTDYNVRSSNVITEAKVNSAIISIGDTVILKNTKAITFPVVTGYALKVEYTDVERGEANVTVFCDGKKVGYATEVVLTGDTATLTLGDKNVSDVRFINTKVVTLGEVDTAAVPTFTAAGLMPCNHSAFNQTDCTFVYGNDFEDADSKFRKLYKSYVCSGCGETLTEQVDNMFNEVVTSDSKGNGINTSLKNGGTVKNIGSNRNIIADNTIGMANDPFWIRFTIDVTEITQNNVENVYYSNKTDKTVQTKGRTFFGTYHNTSSYQHLLRSFVVKNEDYDSTVEGSLPYRTDITQLRIGDGSSGALNPTGSFVTYLEAGKSYDFALYFVPESGDLHVYLDGKFQAKGNVGTMKEDTTKCYGFRFLDAGSGKYNFGNFYMYRDSTYDAHVHSDEWDINSTGKGVLITDTQLSPYYTCYCGEKVFYGDISTLVNDNIADIYNGLGNITLNSADADTWISSDINIRNSVVDGSLITLGENSLLSIKDGKLVSGTTDTGITVSANSSYVTAVKLVSATAYELYVNGKFAASGALTDAGAALTLGDERFGENVRFRYNKVVKIDNDDTTPVLVPKYNDGGVINSCYHEANGNAEDRTVSLEDGVLKYTYVCAKCGERVYTKLNNDLRDEAVAGTDSPLTEANLESVTLTGSSYLYVEKGVLLNGADPYWLTFDLTPTTFTNYNSGKADKKDDGSVDIPANQRTFKGYGVVTIQPTNNTYTSELRLIMDGWEEENAPKEADGYMTKGKTDGVVELKVLHTDKGTTTFRYAPTVAYLKANETVSIALRVDPSTGAYDVYVNGVYIVSSNRGVDTSESSNPRIRFHESGNFTYSNIKLMSYVHEPDYTQEVIDEKYFATPANCAEGARYYKSCVCGEFVDTADTFVGGTELDSSIHAYILENTAFKFLKSKATATDAAVYYKSCGCGLIGEDTFTYGEPHTTHTFAQVVDAKYAAEGENAYYESCSYCGETGTETFVATIPTVTFGDYALESNVTLDGKITVIEMKAKFTPVGTTVMYHPLVKILGTQDEELELLYVEASTGALAIKLADGSYSVFYGAVEQEAKCLNGDEDTKIVIIYDDASGLVRYYVGTYIPYYYEDGARLANEVKVYGIDTFTTAEASSIKLITASEGVAVTAGISKTYNINESGTAEILALQEHETEKGVRVLAGVDMLWYGSVGFEVEVYENEVGKGVKTVYTNKVFESIEAEGETVYASLFTNYEFNYFTAITVKDVDIEEGKSYYIIMTPFTGVGDSVYYGDSVKINVTATSYEFDANYVSE